MMLGSRQRLESMESPLHECPAVLLHAQMSCVLLLHACMYMPGACKSTSMDQLCHQDMALMHGLA